MDIDQASERPKLISESAWLRIYQTASNSFRYESRFSADGLEVDAESLIGAWEGMSDRLRWEFGMAYTSKAAITAEDEKILVYLMGEAGRTIWEMIPIILIRHSDRERVLQFLKNRIEESHTNKANYYQALGLMRAVEAGPLLRQELESLEATRKDFQSPSGVEIDYIACVETLLILFHQEDLKEKLKSLLNHPSKAVQYQAKRALDRE